MFIRIYNIWINSKVSLSVKNRHHLEDSLIILRPFRKPKIELMDINSNEKQVTNISHTDIL